MTATYSLPPADCRALRRKHAKSSAVVLDERDSNILRDVRAKIKTVADCYDIAPEYVVRVLLTAMEKSK